MLQYELMIEIAPVVTGEEAETMARLSVEHAMDLGVNNMLGYRSRPELLEEVGIMGEGWKNFRMYQNRNLFRFAENTLRLVGSTTENDRPAEGESSTALLFTTFSAQPLEPFLEGVFSYLGPDTASVYASTVRQPILVKKGLTHAGQFTEVNDNPAVQQYAASRGLETGSFDMQIAHRSDEAARIRALNPDIKHAIVVDQFYNTGGSLRTAAEIADQAYPGAEQISVPTNLLYDQVRTNLIGAGMAFDSDADRLVPTVNHPQFHRESREAMTLLGIATGVQLVSHGVIPPGPLLTYGVVNC